MATIFDFQQTQTSNSLHSSAGVLFDPGNMGIVVGISLLSFIRAEINSIFSDAIVDFWLPVYSSSVPENAGEKFATEIVGEGISIMLLSRWIVNQLIGDNFANSPPLPAVCGTQVGSLSDGLEQANTLIATLCSKIVPAMMLNSFRKVRQLLLTRWLS